MTQKRKSKRAKRREKQERRRVRRARRQDKRDRNLVNQARRRRRAANLRAFQGTHWWIWLMGQGLEEISLQLECTEDEAAELLEETKGFLRVQEEDARKYDPETVEGLKASYDYVCGRTKWTRDVPLHPYEAWAASFAA